MDFSKCCFKIISMILVIVFGLTSVMPAQAQMLPSAQIHLPDPGKMIQVSSAFTPTLIKGLKIDPQNAFQFEFLMDKGDAGLQGDEFEQEAYKMIKYFMASLALPETDLWVNLSPYEHDRIISDNLGKTEMGRDLLAQDYILKQLTASLMYPEGESGKKFWEEVYARAEASGKSIDIPVNTFNKVWIVPQKGYFYEHDNRVFIADTHLKVMLEEDYVAMQKTMGTEQGFGLDSLNKGSRDVMSDDAKQLIREVIIPVIEREVNEGKNFANLRQIYNAMLLSVWFKKRLKGHILAEAYAGRSNIKGIDLSSQEAIENIWKKYVEAFKVGVYDYMKEEYDPASQQMIPKKYFSGGMTKIAEDEVNLASLTTQKSIATSFRDPVNVQVDFNPAMMAKQHKETWRKAPDMSNAPDLNAAPENRQKTKRVVINPGNPDGSSGKRSYSLEELAGMALVFLLFVFVVLPAAGFRQFDALGLFKSKPGMAAMKSEAPEGVFDSWVDLNWTEDTMYHAPGFRLDIEPYNKLDVDQGYGVLKSRLADALPESMRKKFNQAIARSYQNKHDDADPESPDMQWYQIEDKEVRLKFMAQFVLDNFESFTAEDYQRFKREFDSFLAKYKNSQQYPLVRYLPTLDDWLLLGSTAFADEDVFKNRVKSLAKLSVPASTMHLMLIGGHLRFQFVPVDELDLEATEVLMKSVLPRLESILDILERKVPMNPADQEALEQQGWQITASIMSSLNVIKDYNVKRGGYEKRLMYDPEHEWLPMIERGLSGVFQKLKEILPRALNRYPRLRSASAYPIISSPVFYASPDVFGDAELAIHSREVANGVTVRQVILDEKYRLSPNNVYQLRRTHDAQGKEIFMRCYTYILKMFGFNLDKAMMNETNGGVNLRSDQADIQIMESANGFKFPTVDPAMLQGGMGEMIPTILKIESIPLQNIPSMLGLNTEEEDKPKSANKKPWPLQKAREVEA